MDDFGAEDSGQALEPRRFGLALGEGDQLLRQLDGAHGVFGVAVGADFVCPSDG